MRRAILGPAAALAFFLPTGAAGENAAPPRHQAPPGCARLYTPRMAERAIDATYARARRVTSAERRRLRRYVRCQRNPAVRPRLHWYWYRAALAHDRRVYEAEHPWGSAYVSQYDDSGTHCCGYYATYGVADCGSGSSLPCWPQGTRIELCDQGCVVAEIDDHGPYVGGRDLDLSDSTAAAIGFSGLGEVSWRLP